MRIRPSMKTGTTGRGSTSTSAGHWQSRADGTDENFVKSENILDPGGTIVAARREAKDGEQIEGSAYWVYHYDAQGSTTNLVGVKDGALYRAEENVYDAFGNEETDVKEEPVSRHTERDSQVYRRYAGQQRDVLPGEPAAVARTPGGLRSGIRSRETCTARGHRTCTSTQPITP